MVQANMWIACWFLNYVAGSLLYNWTEKSCKIASVFGFFNFYIFVHPVVMNLYVDIKR